MTCASTIGSEITHSIPNPIHWAVHVVFRSLSQHPAGRIGSRREGKMPGKGGAGGGGGGGGGGAGGGDGAQLQSVRLLSAVSNVHEKLARENFIRPPSILRLMPSYVKF